MRTVNAVKAGWRGNERRCAGRRLKGATERHAADKDKARACTNTQSKERKKERERKENVPLGDGMA